MAAEGQSGSKDRFSRYIKGKDILSVVLSKARTVGVPEKLADNLYAVRSFTGAVARIELGEASRLLRGVAKFTTRTEKRAPEYNLDPAKTKRRLARVDRDLLLVQRYHPEAIRDSRKQFRKDLEAIKEVLPDGADSDWKAHFGDVMSLDFKDKNFFLFNQWLVRLPKIGKEQVIDALVKEEAKKVFHPRPNFEEVSSEIEPQPPVL